MEKLPSSFNQIYLEFVSCTHDLSEAIELSDRAKIVRSCSNLMYFLSDILEQVLPEDASITIK